MESTRTYDGVKWVNGVPEPVHDVLLIEQPLTVLLGDEPLTVTMQTPGFEMELVRGLLHTEGILRGENTVWNAAVVARSKEGLIESIRVDITEEARSVINKRSLLSVASCGICGKTGITFASGSIEPSSEALSPSLIQEYLQRMRLGQMDFTASGGSHACAAFTDNGDLLVVREDVGRHNAVDKVIGHLLFEKSLSKAHALFVSGRVSYEIVAKTFAAGVGRLVAISAPSSLAVDFAKELGIELYGFCREGRATRYS